MILMDSKEIGQIQSNLPVPTRPGGKASTERLAIEELDANESRTFKGYKSSQLVYICSSIRKRYPERKFAVRSIGNSGLVVRVWRLK